MQSSRIRLERIAMRAGRNVALVWAMKIKNKLYHPLVTALDDLIIAAKAAKLKETAALLRIARLDLLMRVHGIKHDELELLSFALAKAAAKPRKKPRTELH
jgi:hypothetical protein